MRVVLLLAGRGTRLGDITKNQHKAFIKLDDFSLLHHLVQNCIDAGIDEFVPIVGYRAEEVLEYLKIRFKSLHVKAVINDNFAKSNNLYSLYCAKELLEGEEFLLCNGDLIFDKQILKDIMSKCGKSAIAVDDYRALEKIDSPKTKAKNNVICELGRHLDLKDNLGYAMGIYKFNKELSQSFFKEAKKMLDADLQAGFHDPLNHLFGTHNIYPHSVKNFLWTDIDEYEDIQKARDIHKQIRMKYE